VNVCSPGAAARSFTWRSRTDGRTVRRTGGHAGPARPPVRPGRAHTCVLRLASHWTLVKGVTFTGLKSQGKGAPSVTVGAHRGSVRLQDKNLSPRIRNAWTAAGPNAGPHLSGPRSFKCNGRTLARGITCSAHSPLWHKVITVRHSREAANTKVYIAQPNVQWSAADQTNLMHLGTKIRVPGAVL
jgi:hypothetical protein